MTTKSNDVHTAREMFPLGAPGGILEGVIHTPTQVRPFLSTLATPVVPRLGKHGRDPTSPKFPTANDTWQDGKKVTDTVQDTGSD